MMMLIDCSGCRTPLQLPHGAPCIRCAICGAVTHVAAAPPAEPSRAAVQPAPGWGPPPPPAHGRKRAVVCGISYRYSRHELKGCINDAKCMRHLLMTRFNFPDDSIIMLNGWNGQYMWEDHRPRSGVWKGTSGGEAISFSGCDDNQTSADTSALSKITSTGAMTFCFIQAIERGQGTTYGSILNSMRSTIRNTGESAGVGGGAVTSLITMLLTGGSLSTGGLKQEPQLTACDMFDVYAKPFLL
nr:unnamed protein product [Digitaria exilis]